MKINESGPPRGVSRKSCDVFVKGGSGRSGTSRAGSITAVFSTFNVIDKDNEVTLPGAFDDGAEVVVSAYGHSSWEGVLPVGRGTIRTTERNAVLDAEFFMDTIGGRETFAVISQLGAKQEWSYGFKATKSEGTFEGQNVTFLHHLDVFEVSPVLRGAGVGTRTIAVDGDPDIAAARSILAEFADAERDREAVEREYLRFIRTGLELST